MNEPLVSVIVPVLNEAAALPATLDRVAALDGLFELVVVDGGSDDATAELARTHALRPQVLEGPRGRSAQMNKGARAASGDVLLFLHADSQLPTDAYRSLVRALDNPAIVGGNFALRFDGGDRFSRLLGAWYALQRRAGVYYGDSVIWVRRERFERLGGFRSLEIMEDYDFARRLGRSGRTACLPGPAVTSARRWQRLGLPRTIASWVVVRWLFLAGVSPARLARLYAHVR